MKKIVILITFLTLLASPTTAQAVTDPLATQNNKVGIHISSENDLDQAATLVNSNGGDWGYVTVVIREDEMDQIRWQNFMQQAKEKHLIPIVRLATTIEGNYWTKPKVEMAKKWAEFLNSLAWPTQNRYVILFNEPNHAKEWGNEISPENYALIARTYWEQFKRASIDFFILPAALDLSAPNSQETISAEVFFQKMYHSDPLIFTIFDGLASHSYPNPNFCGKPDELGPTSIRGFEWEVHILGQYDLIPNTPVFITETGWSCPLTPNTISTYYQNAFNQAWNHTNLVAVTPFILEYQSFPFKNFSWLNEDKEPTPQYTTIQSLPKTKGEPKLITN